MSEKYRAYLKGRLWRRIRLLVLRRDHWRCRSCGDRASQVHHGSYDRDTMAGKDLSKLYSLCRSCHEAVSLDIFGLPRQFKEVFTTTKALDEKAPPRKRRPKKPKRHKVKLTIEGIRAISQSYAEGRMR